MNAPAEKLISDINVLASDIRELLAATASQSGEQLAAVRARVEATLANARDTVVVRGRDAAQVADRYVRDNTWTALGVSAGIGFVIGLLIGRR